MHFKYAHIGRETHTSMTSQTIQYLLVDALDVLDEIVELVRHVRTEEFAEHSVIPTEFPRHPEHGLPHAVRRVVRPRLVPAKKIGRALQYRSHATTK